MAKIDIYETEAIEGACDAELVRIDAAVAGLVEEGYDVHRYVIEPAGDDVPGFVKDYLEAAGMDALPLTAVDGEVVKRGAFPTNDELKAWTGAKWVAVPEDLHASCCGKDAEE